MRKLLILSVFLFLLSPLSATIYYVDKTTGNDGDDGESEGNAWETINKVNISSFNDNDIIKFKKGEIWRERLIPPSSGSSGNEIEFTFYGSGNDPKILGSDSYISGWTIHLGNIY